MATTIEIRRDSVGNYMIRTPDQDLKAGERVKATFEVTDEQGALILGSKRLRLAMVNLLDVVLTNDGAADLVAGLLPPFAEAAKKLVVT